MYCSSLIPYFQTNIMYKRFVKIPTVINFMMQNILKYHKIVHSTAEWQDFLPSVLFFAPLQSQICLYYFIMTEW